MLLSEYLKSKMESDKALATQLDNIVKKLKDNTISLTTNLYSGIERASWYTSCIFEKHNDVCQELKFEDRRMFLAIKQVYKRDDVILDMVKAYIDILMKDFDEQKQTMIAKNILGTSAEIVTNRAIKESIAYLLAKSISASFNFATIVRQRINKYTPYGMTIMAFYGKVQESAMSARHLRDINPSFYWALYSMQLEMLYFLIEPAIPAQMPPNSNSESDIINFINGLIK
ncbi:hypothetical protein [Dickeya dadantii]|uniref:hypothetical protein n=1 Tax=Dickeya dadantii TaxID=204038 RepID=UPI001495D47A|nr:hypothetical protein [Dickeya dadantii]NPE51867.1 hypothetical protein [Dickeya dadantii]UAY94595.1 hypothetical protein KTF62_12025 [Dickeya dadantii]